MVWALPPSAARPGAGAPTLDPAESLPHVRVVVCVLVRMPGHARLDLPLHAAGDVAEGLRGDGIGIEHHDRLAAVAAHHHLRIERHLAQERYAEHVGRAVAAAVAEDLFALAAVPADVVAHVLHDAQHRHV